MIIMFLFLLHFYLSSFIFHHSFILALELELLAAARLRWRGCAAVSAFDKLGNEKATGAEVRRKADRVLQRRAAAHVLARLARRGR
jgi:hypothetical protein